MNDSFEKNAFLSSLPYLLALNRMPGVGPIRLQRLLVQEPNIKLYFDQPKQFPPNIFSLEEQVYLQNPNWLGVEQDLHLLELEQGYILSLNDPRYPKWLKEIYAAPPVLYVLGQVELLNKPQIGIVGSRQATQLGLRNAYMFAKELAQNSWGVTSGLAKGIDAAAHSGALDALGGTCAVLGCGVDVIYPQQNARLYHALIHQGVLVSEFPLGTPAAPSHFPRRNRILAGMCQGILVVEAALKSGSLITARLANEQGRQIFAIPGNIDSALSKGCHQLLREGAKLVENVMDVLEELQSVP